MAKAHVLYIEDVIEPSWRRNSVSLLDGAPEVAAEWYYKKNCGFGPEHFTKNSGVRCWWQCPICSRIYQSTICNRTSAQQSGCPYCASKLVCDENSLSVNFPELAREWHPTKNKKKTVSQIMKASGIAVWWLCSKCSHAWRAAPSDRTVSESGCPACYQAQLEYARLHPQRTETPRRVLSADSPPSRQWYEKPSSQGFVSLYAYSKSIARQWHPIKNGTLTANEIAKGSDAIAWWKCNKGPDHEWQAVVYSRTKTRTAQCPFCKNLRLSVTNRLSTTAPALAKEFHPTLNGGLKPAQVIAGGSTKYWWRCKKNKAHEWETSMNLRIKGSQCPYCSHHKVSKDNCLSREFPYLAAQLHPTKNGNKNGSNIAPQSGILVWWLCQKGPDHEWQAKPSNRTSRGSGCPCCSGKKACSTNSLAALFPSIAKEWDHQKNKLTPDQVTAKSSLEVAWRCKKGHRWTQVIGKRTARGSACYECRTGKPRM